MQAIVSFLRVETSPHFEYGYLEVTEKEEVKAVFPLRPAYLENIIGDKWPTSCCLDPHMLWEDE